MLPALAEDQFSRRRGYGDAQGKTAFNKPAFRGLRARKWLWRFLLGLCLCLPVFAQKVVVRQFTIRTEPGAVVWLDEVRRGVAGENGEIVVAARPGRHVLRVRAQGYREVTRPLAALPRGVLAVRLTASADSAELVFQQAENARERAGNAEERQKAAAFYRRTLQLRPRYAEAHVGLARVLSDLGEYDGALEQIELARAARRVYPEASAVEGRIYRAQSDEENAVAAFERAIKEARGYQPEAHTGLALLYEDKGQYEEAATAFETALAQLYDTEPLLYQLLGEVYEKLERYRDAVRVYEKYLQIAPNGKLAPAIRSVLDQLRRQAAEQDSPPA
jgi:tetratricopeptide (TPR) repeat protein